MTNSLWRSSFFFTLALFAISACAKETADTIYTGGQILTIDDAQPTAEAVAVRDGRILAVGDADAVSALRGSSTEIFDLAGRTMIPGFVDSHGHVVLGGLQALSANLLAPPDGDVADIAGLRASLSAWAEENSGIVEKVNMIVGYFRSDVDLVVEADLDQAFPPPICGPCSLAGPYHNRSKPRPAAIPMAPGSVPRTVPNHGSVQ